MLDTDPPTAKVAISAAGDADRQAMAEMRRLLDVLRVEHDTDSDNDSDHRPQPELSDLDRLVDRTRKAGLPVDVVVTGRARPLPPGPDLCAYRVAQEPLTNILKHAGPTTARIERRRPRTRTASAACASAPSSTAVSSPPAHVTRAGSP